MLINRLKNHKKDVRCKDILGRKSWYMTTTDIIKLKGKPINTINFLFDDFTSISNQFKKYDIQIQNKHLNKAKRKVYHKKHLNTNQKKFIDTFYREDIIMYNTLVKEKLQAEATPTVETTHPVETTPPSRRDSSSRRKIPQSNTYSKRFIYLFIT